MSGTAHPSTVRFSKYQGLGNDFLIVDLRNAPAQTAAQVQQPASVIALCDRQFGVGGDGVLAVLPSAHADVRMRVLNSDGSEAEMCGNGLRCVVKELYDRGGLRRPEMTVETGAGPLRCRIDVRDGVADTVAVEMGAPRLRRAEIPMAGAPDERCVEQAIELGGEMRALTCVSMGNPHAIAFVASRDEALRLARRDGTALEHHAWFPSRTNAEFAHVRSRRELDLVVWERGCGITLACGTGACATVVAAVLTGRADADAEVQVHLLGGTLAITVPSALDGVTMRGPARHVFDGELALAQLEPRPAG